MNVGTNESTVSEWRGSLSRRQTAPPTSATTTAQHPTPRPMTATCYGPTRPPSPRGRSSRRSRTTPLLLLCHTSFAASRSMVYCDHPSWSSNASRRPRASAATTHLHRTLPPRWSVCDGVELAVVQEEAMVHLGAAVLHLHLRLSWWLARAATAMRRGNGGRGRQCLATQSGVACGSSRP